MGDMATLVRARDNHGQAGRHRLPVDNRRSALGAVPSARCDPICGEKVSLEAVPARLVPERNRARREVVQRKRWLNA
jgi:hypothetical protein